MSSREFLDRIPKQVTVARKPPRVSVSTCIEQHTRDFVLSEAEARNMGPGEFIRHILELLESGEF